MAANKTYELVFEREIPELRTFARFYRHIRTGAEILSLINDDVNKVFGIIFRTPPANSTGVAHILEHSVLCGSRKYPVKEPFVELLKGSLKTFLNAFTYPDKTCYPVASQNVQDFYNLVDVYLDAVFYPRITPFIFQQEGWHYELDKPGEPLGIKGVVYNEMKGVYSSPDSLIAELSQQSLFPDTTYGLDSGGDPQIIPRLTYEEFKSFHEKFYHPSNARIFFHGNDDPDRRLEIVEEYLGNFRRTTPGSGVPLQASKAEPRRIVRPFAAGDDTADSEDLKGMITVNWLLPETTDPGLSLAFQVLEYILLGMPGSPLKKALIESGLGEDLCGTGLENELRQLFFSTGLKGIRMEDADRVETLIFATLSKLARDGIDQEAVEAGVNTIEFQLRENNPGGYPQGLTVMLRALTTWLYDADPTAMLAFESPLEWVKQTLRSGTFFQDLIRRYLLDNPHRSVVLLKPDHGLAARQSEEERRKLGEIKESFTPDRIRDIIENTATLRRLQSTPDAPEALAKIPVLKIADLEKKNKVIPCESIRMEHAEVVFHDLFTSGIVYFDTGMNLRALPRELLPYAPLFGRALLEMGTRLHDFVFLSQKISRKTGGIRPEVFASAFYGKEDPVAYLFLRGKSMVPQAPELFGILGEVLCSAKLDNRERFRQIVLEEKARQERKVVPAGHQIVNTRIRAHFHQADWVKEQTSGISYLLFLTRLVKKIDNDWGTVLEDLERIRQLLASRSSMVFNLTLDRENLDRLEHPLNGFLNSLPDASADWMSWQPELYAECEGITIPAQVNYVGKGANLFREGYEFDGSSKVVEGYLRASWLWEKIRVQGGAYGGFCAFDHFSGTFTFLSYRDPNLLQTIENYDGAARFLKTADIGEEEVRKAIIGAIGDLDGHMLPDTRGFVSLKRGLCGMTEEDRQRMRDRILATRIDDFRAFADVLETVNRRGIVKILGSQASIDSALAARPGWLQTFRLL